ncbi:sulfite exporter TauE/SafE family protein [Shewanella maritima]|uniref:sulfite exporter TauE/SafE family protein n=1 Tax=Shewanella maritima TaxID=2520507 RepID=UPI00373511F6
MVNSAKSFLSKRPFFSVLLAIIPIVWCIWALQFEQLNELLISHSGFVFLGVLGAIFANSTGAGGGVIFIPVFSALGMSPEQMVSTSFAIQCFGMTVGAITWIWHYLAHHQHDATWQAFYRFVIVGALCSIAGLWSSNVAQIAAPVSLHTSFSWFSIVLGIIIIWHGMRPGSSTLNSNLGNNLSQTYHRLDIFMIMLISFIGGIITSWLSVGVGEIIVIYLMLRGYCTKLAIATGVVVSAITVWSMSPLSFALSGETQFDVLLFAGPGAMIGGLYAKRIALWFSITRLKLFFAFWIILTGAVMLVLN